jgi:hypothetical protein
MQVETIKIILGLLQVFLMSAVNIPKGRIVRAIPCAVIIALVLILARQYNSLKLAQFRPHDPKIFDKVIGSIFENFDNETGTKDGSFIVPKPRSFPVLWQQLHFVCARSVCVGGFKKKTYPGSIYNCTVNRTDVTTYCLHFFFNLL